MSRAAVTHFDGDPFVLDFWLLLYDKYWRGEVDKVYADVCYDESLVTPDLLERQKASLAKYPEIEVEFIPEIHPPEWGNPRLISKVTEDYLMLLESDGWVFGRGVVDRYFKVLESGEAELVAGNYRLFPPECDERLGYVGFMRNFLFVKTDYFKTLELDFYPRTHDGLNLDCFGFISYQLAQRKVKVQYVPCNFMVDPPDADFKTFPWLHIRQMNSSILGFGWAGNGIFKGLMGGDQDKINAIRNEITGAPAAIWQYTKACAARLIMLYALRDITPFGLKYKETIKNAVFSLGLDWDKVQGLVTYYRTVMKV